MSSARITYSQRSDAAPELEMFRDARAAAWRYALDCLAENRPAKKKATRPGGPDDTKESKNDGAARTNLTK
jgi:hypothetical protein